MLLHLDSGMQTLRSIIRQNRHSGLKNHLPGIHPGVNIMHGAARLACSILDSLHPSLFSGIFWQKGRVDVQNPIGKRTQERLFNDPHETRETNEIDSVEPI